MGGPMQTINKLLVMEQVQSSLLEQARRPQHSQGCDLVQCLGRVLAQDVVSPIDVPGFDNSAMDGYALCLQDTPPSARFPVVQRIVAGQVGHALQVGQAARIMTGAAIPEGCDVVVAQEDTVLHEQAIEVSTALQVGRHIRRRGEDIAVGQVVLKRGTRLQAKHLGLAASVGLAQLPVYERLKVGLFFTGDELLEPGVPLRAGMIYNSNRYAIAALLRSLGCEVNDYGVVADDAQATREMLLRASAENHLVVTSGGVSVGEEDHVRLAAQALGQLSLWQVAIKPGKPFAFGRIGAADFIGLPGNPVSAYVTFVLLAAVLVKRRQGRDEGDCLPAKWRVPADFTWMRRGRVREFLRVVAKTDANGGVRVSLSSPQQGAGVMSSIALADGLVEIPVDTGIAPGDWVWYYPFVECA